MIGAGLIRAAVERCSLLSHRQGTRSLRPISISSATLPSVAPRPSLNIKSIRQNPDLYSQTCLDRHHNNQAGHPQRIVQLFDQWLALQKEARGLRERSNVIQSRLGREDEQRGDEGKGGEIFESRALLLAEARGLKETLQDVERHEKSLDGQIESLAIKLPNLINDETPHGTEPKTLSFINEDTKDQVTSSHPNVRSHVRLGSEFKLLDFKSAASTSGWGFYFLRNEAAKLEQALTRYASDTAEKHGFELVTPPSLVYSHIATACGFRPRDQNGEEQIYSIQQSNNDTVKAIPPHSLSGTAEIPLAGMNAKTVLSAGSLPLRVVGPSRCYRAEAGARGAQTKGLYRVHEFTKVEMFAWTTAADEQDVFDSMISVQKEILQNLGFYCRILEMPSADLGASASRKWDIEVYFPSRAGVNGGWGEVTSTSLCTDYQSRRLDTRVKGIEGLTFPHTVNGTALAVPRVLAALLEYGYLPEEDIIKIPEVLWPYMNGIAKIEKKGSKGSIEVDMNKR